MIVAVIHNDREYWVEHRKGQPYQVQGFVPPRAGARFGYYRSIWWALDCKAPSKLVQTILDKAAPLIAEKAARVAAGQRVFTKP